MNSILRQAKKIVIPSRKQQQAKIKVARTAFELVRKQIGKYKEITSIEFGSIVKLSF